MNIFKTFLILGCVLPYTCHSQLLGDNYYSKVVVELEEEKTIFTDSVHIDTLVLKDGAKLKFIQNSILIVENAFIGNNCELNSFGLPGVDGKTQELSHGSNGADGKNLILVIDFKVLGSLTINTNGGAGGNGARGRPGDNGGDGQSGSDGGGGGNGGSGGNGGNLTLIYSHEGFVPIFNSKRNHSIQLNYDGGNPGLGGQGGQGGRGGKPLIHYDYKTGNYTKINPHLIGNGSFGGNGSSGTSGKKGELILNRKER